jgi:2'-5' RNA ligase
LHSENNSLEHGAGGWFALVSYIQDPQKSFLESLRQSIPGKPLAPVHITVLPPRPLGLPVEEVCQRVEDVTGGLSAFEAELSEVRHFSETDFLYLDIAEGYAELCNVHTRLNAGELRHPEVYEYRPHLTLGGPVPPEALQTAQKRTETEWKSSACPRRVKIEELVCLWMSAEGEHEWERCASFRLTGADSIVAGLREF